jgi:pyridoxamine 5'-phosphate oxidase family protein
MEQLSGGRGTGDGGGQQEGDVSVCFSEEEIAFLLESRVARVATISADGQPHVVPVVYEFDGTAFYFAGWNLHKTLKFKNILENGRIAIVVDDVVTVCPWRPRGVEVRGTAEPGSVGGRTYVKVIPRVKRCWGFN